MKNSTKKKNEMLEQVKNVSISIDVKNGELGTMIASGSINGISLVTSMIVSALVRKCVDTPEEQLELLKSIMDGAANVIIKKSGN